MNAQLADLLVVASACVNAQEVWAQTAWMYYDVCRRNIAGISCQDRACAASPCTCQAADRKARKQHAHRPSAWAQGKHREMGHLHTVREHTQEYQLAWVAPVGPGGQVSISASDLLRFALENLLRRRRCYL